VLEPSLYRRRHTVLDVLCRVRLSSSGFAPGLAGSLKERKCWQRKVYLRLLSERVSE